MENLAPILLFVYNRPEHTKKTIEALKKNDLASKSKLYIFSDGARDETQIEKVNQVRSLINNIQGFNEVKVILSNSNKGLAKSIIDGVTMVINKFEKVIVLEDDLLTSKYYLTYMNEALHFYKSVENIWSISGYSPNIKLPINYQSEIYITPRGCSWGWGTWKDRWNIIDWNIDNYESFRKSKGERKKFNIPGNDMAFMLDDQLKGYIDSWAIRWCYNQFKQEGYTIYPIISFIENIGMSGDATHGSINSKRYKSNFSNSRLMKLEIVLLDNDILTEFARFNKLTIINYIGRLLKSIGLYRKVKRLYKKIM